MQQDFLQRFLFERFEIRGALIRLGDSWQELQGITPYPVPVRSLLGRALAAAGLLMANLKFRGSLSLQVQSSGQLRLLLAQCNDQGDLRGLARLLEEAPGGSGEEAPSLDEVDEADLLLNPILSLNLEPAGRGQPYQGIVPFQSASFKQSLEHYFEQSEQLDTRVHLAVSDHSVAGLLLQRLPGAAPDQGMDDWQHVTTLAETIRDDELLTLDPRDLLRRLFVEEDLRLFSAEPLRFHCTCSRERVSGMLRNLGEAEVQDILQQQGEVEVHCEYCNQRYAFDELDVGQIFLAGEQIPDSGQA